MSTAEEFRRMSESVRNWGRWGSDDERGTLNLISDAHRVRAASLVRSGRVFDLGLPLDSNGPQRGGLRTNPIRLMSAAGASPDHPEQFCFADDYVIMPLQSGTQWDALGHVWCDETLYNGFPAASVTSRGLAHVSIDRLAPGIVGRGVLLDVARHRGVERLSAGEQIDGDDLEAVAAAQGVAITEGDILLVRTGWSLTFAAGDRDTFMSAEPGLSPDAVGWLARQDVAALACDNWGIGAKPGRDPMDFYHTHLLLLRDVGMPLGELFVLEELAEDCAADGCYEFFFCSEILKFTGGAGTPTNPVALK